MSTFRVQYLTNDGGLATIHIRGWHAAAAEITAAALFGGSFHTATEVSSHA